MIIKLKNGSGIHIKKKNRGSFTRWCGGNVTDECIRRGKNSSNPKIRKKATFAANVRKWKHQLGGTLLPTRGISGEFLGDWNQEIISNAGNPIQQLSILDLANPLYYADAALKYYFPTNNNNLTYGMAPIPGFRGRMINKYNRATPVNELGLTAKTNLVNVVENPAEKQAALDFLRENPGMRGIINTKVLPGVSDDWAYPMDVMIRHGLRKPVTVNKPIVKQQKTLLIPRKTLQQRSLEYYNEKVEDKNLGISKRERRQFNNAHAMESGDMRHANLGRPSNKQINYAMSRISYYPKYMQKEYDKLRLRLAKKGFEGKDIDKHSLTRDFFIKLIKSHGFYKSGGIINKFLKGGFTKLTVVPFLYALENPLKKGVYPDYVVNYDSRTIGPGVDSSSGVPSWWFENKRVPREDVENEAYNHLKHDDEVIRKAYDTKYGNELFPHPSDTLSIGPRLYAALNRYLMGTLGKGKVGRDAILSAMKEGNTTKLKTAILKFGRKGDNDRMRRLFNYMPKVYK